MATTFHYPPELGDKDNNKPFIYLGARDFKPVTDATAYIQDNKKRTKENTNYEYVFGFYVPDSLSYGYSPTITQAKAVVDNKVIDFIKGKGNLNTLASGLAQSAINEYMTSTNNSMIGKIVNSVREYKNIEGKIFDPKQLNVVTDSNYLNFSLNYKFYPKNTPESTELMKMLWVLKKIVAPSYDGNSVKQAILGFVKTANSIIKNEKSTQLEGDKLKQNFIITYYNKRANETDQSATERQKILDDISEVKYIKKFKDLGWVEMNDVSGDYLKRPESPPDEKEKETKKETNTLQTIGFGKLEQDIKKGVSDLNNKMKKIEEDKQKLQSEGFNFNDFLKALTDLRIDMWQAPLIFDLYLVQPKQTKDKNGEITISSTDELPLFQDAKAMLCKNITINMVSNPNRADVPFYENGSPLGWEVNMDFVSVGKVINT